MVHSIVRRIQILRTISRSQQLPFLIIRKKLMAGSRTPPVKKGSTLNRATFFDGQKWCINADGTLYSGEWVDRLAAYENTGMEPDEINSLITSLHAVVQACAPGSNTHSAITSGKEAVRSLPWQVLNVSTRTRNCISGIYPPVDTVGDLADVKLIDISRLRNVGKKTCQEIASQLQLLGIKNSDWYKFIEERFVCRL